MKTKIKALFYNYNITETEVINSELDNLGYILERKLTLKLSEVKAEILNSTWDILVIDKENSGEAIEEIIEFINDLDSQISVLIVSNEIDSELLQIAFKNGNSDIATKSNKCQVCLALIRNYEKTKFLNQHSFTSKELLRLQKTQNEHTHFLNQVIESTSNPIFYKGVEGRYLGCNSAFAKLLGLSKEDIIGKTVFDISPKELAEKYYEMDQEFFKNPVTQEYDYKVASADGKMLDVIFFKTAIRDDKGNVSGLLGHMFDITERKKLETELKKEKDLAQNILDTSNEAYITVDLKGNITSVNKKTCEIFKYSKEELIGKNWFENIILKTEQENSRRMFNSVIQDNADLKETVIRKILTSDNEEKEMSWRNRQIRNDKGEIIGVLSSGREVVTKDQLVQRLEISEKKYQILVENMHEGLSIVDLNEVVTYCNPAFDNIFGFERGGMLCKNLKDFFVKEDLKMVENETKKRKEYQKSQYKVKIKRKDNTERILNISSVPFKNLKNEVTGAISMVMDITAEEYARRRLKKKIMIEQSIVNISSQFISTNNFETKLNNTLKELQKIIEAERYGVLTINYGKLNLVTEQHFDESSIMGIDFEQIDYLKFTHCLNMLESLDFIFINDMSELPPEAQFEKEVFEKYRIFNFLGIPFYSGSELKGLLTISNIYEAEEWTIEDLSLVRTISDIVGHAFNSKWAEEKVEKLNQDLLTKNNELEQVVYVTSHDIRSPVVNILGFSDEMTKALKKLTDKIFDQSNTISNKEDIEFLLNRDVPQILNFIKISGQKIDKLLLALLKLSRLGRASINKVDVDMNKLMSTIISTFEYRVKQENIKIQIDELPNCFTDEVQLNQVFSNLIDNAIKYRSHEREARIKVSGVETDDSITYCVEDNGIGISNNELDKIFDVFYRINPENQDGEGMGLALIKKTIERLGGNITIGSEQGKGSKFYVSIYKTNV